MLRSRCAPRGRCEERGVGQNMWLATASSTVLDVATSRAARRGMFGFFLRKRRPKAELYLFIYLAQPRNEVVQYPCLSTSVNLYLRDQGVSRTSNTATRSASRPETVVAVTGICSNETLKAEAISACALC